MRISEITQLAGYVRLLAAHPKEPIPYLTQENRGVSTVPRVDRTLAYSLTLSCVSAGVRLTCVSHAIGERRGVRGAKYVPFTYSVPPSTGRYNTSSLSLP